MDRIQIIEGDLKEVRRLRGGFQNGQALAAAPHLREVLDRRIGSPLVGTGAPGYQVELLLIPLGFLDDPSMETALAVLLGLQPDQMSVWTEDRRVAAAKAANFSLSSFSRRIEPRLVHSFAVHILEWIDGREPATEPFRVISQIAPRLRRLLVDRSGAIDAHLAMRALHAGFEPLIALADQPASLPVEDVSISILVRMARGIAERHKFVVRVRVELKCRVRNPGPGQKWLRVEFNSTDFDAQLTTAESDTQMAPPPLWNAFVSGQGRPEYDWRPLLRGERDAVKPGYVIVEGPPGYEGIYSPDSYVPYVRVSDDGYLGDLEVAYEFETLAFGSIPIGRFGSYVEGPLRVTARVDPDVGSYPSLVPLMCGVRETAPDRHPLDLAIGWHRMARDEMSTSAESNRGLLWPGSGLFMTWMMPQPWIRADLDRDDEDLYKEDEMEEY